MLPTADPLQGLVIEVVDKKMEAADQVKAKIELLSTFAQVQHAITPPKKDAEAGNGGKFSYKYATLDAVLKSIIDASKDLDIGFWQKPVRYGNAIGVINYIFNGAGAIINFGAFLLPAGRTPQDAGAALTYSKRYSISSIFGVASEEDDDGRQTESNQKVYTFSPQQLEQYEVLYNGKKSKLSDIYDEAVKGVEEAQKWIRKRKHNYRTTSAIKQLDEKYMKREADRKAKEKAEKEAAEAATIAKKEEKKKALDRIKSTPKKEDELVDPFPESKVDIKDDITDLFKTEVK